MRNLALILYGISGLCLLALETIWIRAIGLQVGGTALASALVLMVFFLSAAAGHVAGAVLSGRVSRPWAAYGTAELLTALSTVALFPLQSRLTALLAPASAGAFGQAAGDVLFVAALAGLPSFFAGASFPFLSAALVNRLEERTRRAGAVYAGNLFGAALGVIVGGLVLPATMGYTRALILTCALLALEGMVAIVYAFQKKAGSAESVGSNVPQPKPTNVRKREHDKPETGTGFVAPVVVFASGLLTIGLEMLCLIWFRQIRQPSVYALAATLFAFIIGLSGGAWLAALVRRRGVPVERALSRSLWIPGFLALVYPWLFYFLQKWSTQQPLPTAPIADSAKVALATSLMLFPLLLAAGAVLPLAWELARRQDAWHGRAVGLLTALNKVGAATGAVAAPLLLLPVTGLAGAIICAGAVYLGLALLLNLRLDARIPRLSRLALPILCSVLALVMAWLWKPSPYVPATGEKVLAMDESAAGIATTVDDATGSRHIVLDQYYLLNGTGNSLLSQKQESWIPLTLSPAPRRVLFIGMASGISANAALDFPIAQLDTAELVPGVIRSARTQFRPWNARLFADPRAHVLAADGRRVVQSAAPQTWDVIICDLLLPASEGTSALYSRDFLERAASRLTSEGLFCLWLPLYQLDATLAGTVLRTFTEVFPCAIAVRGNFDPLQPIMGLVGAKNPINLSSRFLEARLASPGPRRAAAESAVFESVTNFRLLFQGDLMGVRNEYTSFPVITDDRPVFTFIGPRPPKPGEALRGNTLLLWFGPPFVDAPMPSCRLEETTVEEVSKGRQAGNHFFSAAVQNVTIPGASFEKQMVRLRNASDALKQAQTLCPEVTLSLKDLGK